MLVSFVLVFAACSSDDDSGDAGSDTPDKAALIVGAKDFAGAQIISQAYGQTLAEDGYRITYRDNIGPSETVFPLLENGDIDLYGEFSGTFLTYLGGQPTSDSDEVFNAVETALESKDIVAVGPATAQDVNAFYVLEDGRFDNGRLRHLSDRYAGLCCGGATSAHHGHHGLGGSKRTRGPGARRGARPFPVSPNLP
jgi:glycine betaine/choline ABC-type transport system substrate-binding protein